MKYSLLNIILYTTCVVLIAGVQAEVSNCVSERKNAQSIKGRIGNFIPKCSENGDYSSEQCHGSTGYCWCVDVKTGVQTSAEKVRGDPHCA